MPEPTEPVEDLRSALALLRQRPGELRVEPAPVAANCELAGHYAAHGGGVPVAPPTQAGPALLFENVLPARLPVVVGMFGTRARCAAWLDTVPEMMAERLIEAAHAPLPAVLAPPSAARHCQSGARVDLSQLPIPTMTADDAGPYIALGLCMASDAASGAQNASVHRLCVQGPDALTIWMVPGRHLERLYLAAKARGKHLPVAIHIGLDPAIYLASCCPSTLAPLGRSELAIAGALRGRPYRTAPCSSIDACYISHAEYVLEAEITAEIVPESKHALHSMPEFLGYDGAPHPGLPLVRIKAITHRQQPIFQTVIGPGYEQSNLLGIGMEAAILDFVRRYVTERVRRAYCSSAGGGYLLLFLQFRKACADDDGAVRQAALAVFGAFRMIKQIVLVDDDVNVFSEEDVWWAMTTRFQVDRDLIAVENVRGFPLDPSQQPRYSPSISSVGLTSKVAFDCSVPFESRAPFARSQFVRPART